METLQDNPAGVARWQGLGTRMFSALILLVLAGFCVIKGGVIFASLILLAAIIMHKEWDKLAPEDALVLRAFVYPLTIFPCAAILWLRSLGTNSNPAVGEYCVITLIAAIAATDIGAYFTGRLFGKRKLAPVISPNKTWEGLAGGVVGSVIAVMIILPYAIKLSFFARLLTGIMIALLAQAGDILESWVKRRAGVKDSGTLIPGHGGLLDRVDGYLLSAPAFALLVYLQAA